MACPPDQDNHRPVPPVGRPVLVVGTDDWAVEQAVESLTGSGHRVLTCHPPGQPALPCNALVEGRTCPLDVGFDVVVTVRARPVDQPALGEMGVICGLHAGAVLVAAGMAGRNPFDRWATPAAESGLDAAVAEAAANRIAAWLRVKGR